VSLYDKCRSIFLQLPALSRKYDGHRLVAIVVGSDLKLVNRNRQDRDALFREPFQGLVAGLPPRRTARPRCRTTRREGRRIHTDGFGRMIWRMPPLSCRRHD